ncbi:NAD(P)-binding protein [Lojkania enalia]|uniref:NAD(P)-binding protein n=1 Tax=Lojkania enalia TaxID=147567 RepID=A0A9P4MY52_9PLEO|nr:NAD(P)-binding protein [Didymosphaeria enalia]
MAKLFITGATGYIGGDALYVIANSYPDLEITALVRNSDKGAKIATQYPKIRLVYGTLDSTELLTTEASSADIVLHCADADHQPAASALIAGLGQKPTKSFLIHTSGTGILCFEDYSTKTYGMPSSKIYDDWDGISEVTHLPDDATHRDVDKVVLAASEMYPGNVSTAIVCPPCIYGPGRGPDNRKSVQVYRMARAALQRGKGFHVMGGMNTWTQIHVQDLSDVFLALVTAALQDGRPATWNSEGYYFAENGELAWGEIAKGIAKTAVDKKLIKTDDIDKISPDEADKLTTMGSYLWGMNSRCKAIRAKKLFGWEPKQKSLEQLLPDIVDLEARELGLIKGHAEQAAG